MRQLRLPGASCVTPFVALRRNTSGRFPAFARRRGEIATPTPGCCLTGLTLFLPVLCPKDAFGSPKFPANPSCICPVLRLRPGLHARLSRRFGVVPRTARRRRPQRLSSFEAQSHGFCTGCLRFVPSSRTTTQNSLPVVSQPFRVGFLIPTEFVRRVSAFASSLPGLILARLALALALGLGQSKSKSKSKQE